MLACVTLLADTLVRAVNINALATASARIFQALVDVQLAVWSGEAFVAFTAVRVRHGDALSIVSARLIGAVVNFVTVIAFPSQRTRASVI